MRETLTRILNHVDLDKISVTEKAGELDRSKLKKKMSLQAKWNTDPAKKYQLEAELSFEGGKQIVEIDSPSYLGGNGSRPGPIALCMAGMASCFLTTLASVAAKEAVEFEKLSIIAECSVNFAKALDIADEPIIENIEFRVDASAKNTDRSTLVKLISMAEERCPAVYTATHTVSVITKLV